MHTGCERRSRGEHNRTEGAAAEREVSQIVGKNADIPVWEFGDKHWSSGVKGESAEAPPVAEKARRFRGSGAIGAPEGARESLCRNGGQAPTVLGFQRGYSLQLREYPL